jgi:hypothetical protein
MPSLLNTPTPEFRSAAASLYGERGPARSSLDYRRSAGRKAPEGEPQSLADHIDSAISRVAGLGPKQKLSLHNELVRMVQNINFLKMAMESARGPWSEQAMRQDEGRLL